MDAMDCTQVIHHHFSDSEDECDDHHLQRKSVAFLKLLSGQPLPESTFSLFIGKNYIGRADSCDICINSQTLSKQHAVIEIDKKAKHFEIYDLGSSNKTRKGKIVLKPNVRYSLEHDANIFFADVEFLFQVGSNKETDDLSSETGSESMFETNNPVSTNSSPEKSLVISESPLERSSIINESTSSSLPEKRRLFCSPFSEDESPHTTNTKSCNIVAETPAAALFHARMASISDSQSTVKDHSSPNLSPSGSSPRNSKYSSKRSNSQARSLQDSVGNIKDEEKSLKDTSSTDFFTAETQPYEDQPATQLYSSQSNFTTDPKYIAPAATQPYIDDSDTESSQKFTKIASRTDLGIATQPYVASDSEDDSRNDDHQLPATQLYIPDSQIENDTVTDDPEPKKAESKKEYRSPEKIKNHASSRVTEASPSATKTNDSLVTASASVCKGEKDAMSKDGTSTPEELAKKEDKKGRSLSRNRKQSTVKKLRDSSLDSAGSNSKLTPSVPVVLCVDVASPKLNKKEKVDTTVKESGVNNEESLEKGQPSVVVKGKPRTRKRAVDVQVAPSSEEPEQPPKNDLDLEEVKSPTGRGKRKMPATVAGNVKATSAEEESMLLAFPRGRRRTNNSQSSEIILSDKEENSKTPVKDSSSDELKTPKSSKHPSAAVKSDCESSPKRKTKRTVKQKDTSSVDIVNDAREVVPAQDDLELPQKRKTKRTPKCKETSQVAASENDVASEAMAQGEVSPETVTSRTRRRKKHPEPPEVETPTVSKRGKNEELRVDPLVLVLNKSCSSAGSSPYSIQKGRSRRQVGDEAKTMKIESVETSPVTSTPLPHRKVNSSRKRKEVNYAEVEDDNDLPFEMDENENVKELTNQDLVKSTAKELKKNETETSSSTKKGDAKRVRSVSSTRRKNVSKWSKTQDDDDSNESDEPLGSLRKKAESFQKGTESSVQRTVSASDENATASGRSRRRKLNDTKVSESKNTSISETPVVEKKEASPVSGSTARKTRSGRKRKADPEINVDEMVDDGNSVQEKGKSPTSSLRQFRKKNNRSDNSSEGLDNSLNDSRTSISPSRMFDSRVEDDDDDDDDNLPLQESLHKRSTNRSRQSQKRQREKTDSTKKPLRSKGRSKKSETAKAHSQKKMNTSDEVDEGEPPKKSPKSSTRGRKSLKENELTPKTTAKPSSTTNDLNITNSSETGVVSKIKKGRPKKLQQRKVEVEQNITSPEKFNCYLSVDAPCISFTGVNDQQAEKIVKELGGKVTDNILECTHLVTDKVRRTCKFLSQVARGRPIVTIDWLHRCKKDKKFADASPYSVSDVAAEKQFGFKLQDSLIIASNRPLLQEYSIHVTPGVKPEPSQMKSIIECAGGQFLSRMPASNVADRRTIVISCTEDLRNCSRALAGSVPVVSAEFILTGILKQSDDIESYCLIT